MRELSIGDIVTRYRSLQADRTGVEEVWRLLERFTRPLAGRFYMSKEHDSVDWRRRQIYDSTAIQAAASLSASLQGNLVSPSVKWFDLRYGRHDMNLKNEAMEWLEASSETLFYELLQSNFNEQIGEAFDDLVTFGNTAIVEEWDVENDQLDFTTIPVREVYFEPDYNNQIERFYRKLELTAIQIADKFAPDDDISKLPQPVQAQLESNDVQEMNRFEVIHCIYKRPFNVWKNIDLSEPMVDPKKMPVGYKYIMVNEQAQLGEEGGYFEMPTFLARWRTTAGSRWGHSPGIYTLSNTMTLNQAVQDTLESVEKMIEPPIMTTQRGLLSDLEMFRGGVNVVGDMNDLAPFPVGGDVNAQIIMVDDLRSQIRAAYYVDQLELKESPAMTATEVNVRYELMQRLLGPTLGRLQADLLDPLIQRTFNLLVRAGKIEIPSALMGARDQIDVEYVGPLPRSQKQSKAQSMLGWYGQLASLAEIRPELLDIVDADKLFQEVGMLTGVPAAVIRSETEVRKIRADRKAQQEAMMKAEQDQMQAQTAKTTVEAEKAAAALPPQGIQALQRSVAGGTR